jgi:tetratricopeptide (TPR) repeat protein
MTRIFSPLLILTIIFLILVGGCSDSKTRKIKLAQSGDAVKTSGSTGTSILKVAPEQQKSLVIRYFKNHTGDRSLDWLERGLSDMLITELSQSPYFIIVNEVQFLDAAQRMGKSKADIDNRVEEIRVARDTEADILLCGHISYQNNLLRIQIEATDVFTGADLRTEVAEGESLEKLFSMVDELSGRIRQFLRHKGEQKGAPTFNLAQMTNSLEAFRCYSKALENREKYLYPAAEDCLEEALRYDSTFAAAYLQLMTVRRSLKKPVNLQEYVDKIKRHIDKLSYTDKVKLQLFENELRGEPFKIFSILEEAVETSPMDLELRFTLAQQYRMWGHQEKAMQEFQQILEMDPGHKMVYNDLGYLYANMGDFQTAQYMLEKYQELAPDEPNPYDSKGEILMWAGKLNDALEAYHQALKIMPGYYNSAFRLSDIYTELGDKEKALKYLHHAIKYIPSTGFEISSDFNRARIHWRFGEYKEADKYFSKLLRKHPWMSGVMIRQVEMYRSQGRYKEAHNREMELFKQFQDSLESLTDSHKYLNSYLEFVSYSDISVDDFMPVLEKMLDRVEKPSSNLNIGYMGDFCNLYAGNFHKVKDSFEEKMPQLSFLLKIQRNEIGWGSTWKNLFLFFDDESTGDDLSKVFHDYIVKLAAEEGRKDLEFIANMARARVYGREDDKERISTLYKKYGTPMEEIWKICGPFREYNKSGFDYAFPPEKEIKLAATYKSSGNQVSWKDGQDKHRDGHLNFLDMMNQSSFTAAYALIYVNSPDERKVQIRIGSDETCKFWLNDELIWQHYIKRGAVVDRDIVTVILHSGYNKVLLKITNTDLDWGFYFRLTDEEGYGYSDLKFVSPDDLETSLASQFIAN